MSGRGPMPCRFGVDCHRKDCWYSHPAGRAIDAGGGGNINSGGNGGAAGAAGGGGGGGGGMRLGTMPGGGGGGMMPQPSPRMGGGDRCSAGGRGGGGGRECRYSYECKRQNCHFSHPFGRAIDAEGGGGGGRPSLNRPPSNNSIGSLSRGMSEMSFGDYPPANATDDHQDLKDTWFPKAMDCTCCKGYVYGCTAEICEAMGQCTCSIEEKDLEGGGSEVASNISRTSSPAVRMGVPNGGSMGVGGDGVRPPQPPAEAAMAAAAVASGGGGGRPSSGRGGGGTECRYGTGCKRANCSFSHPQGRNMDADGVYFGDFGGGGGGAAGGKSSAQAKQDLMDTWYPDCRECACCKGYKHGCKTTACEAAGLCACSAGGGPAAPISAVVGTDASSKPEAAAAAPASAEQGGGGAGAEAARDVTSPTAQATA